MTEVPEAEWRARAAAHERRVDALLHGHRERRRRGARHPVEDFLFTYYSYRPAQLRRWRPDAGVHLAGARNPGDPASTVDVAATLARRGETVRWIRDLLAATASRPPQLGCFGLHEWAMLYRETSAPRHESWPLRLAADEVATVVEERGLRCSHFDAYRFFTPPARPLNLLQPSREAQHANEQPGCLHANMDLYKWSYKLAPLVGSETVADCFELARDIRGLDMRASPYDLSDLGYEPVRIETPAGRAAYAAAQREFAERAAPLRARVLAIVDGAVSGRSGAEPAVKQPRPAAGIDAALGLPAAVTLPA
jgi:hypothetical protein